MSFTSTLTCVCETARIVTATTHHEPVEVPNVLDDGVREAGAFAGERRHAWIQHRHGRLGWVVEIDSPIGMYRHDGRAGSQLGLRLAIANEIEKNKRGKVKLVVQEVTPSVSYRGYVRGTDQD